MRRSLMILSFLGSLALLGAGAGSATVTYDGATQWFIGRGDVIAYAGKPALVEHPVVVASLSGQITATCVFADGTRAPATGEYSAGLIYWAQPRHAPGNGTITGYTAGPQNLDTARSTIWSYYECAGGRTDVASIVDIKVVSHTETLSFEGVTIPGPYNSG